MKTFYLACICLFLWIHSSFAIDFTTESHSAYGFVSNTAKVPMGVCLYVIDNEGVGWYADAKINLNFPLVWSTYESIDLYEAEVEHESEYVKTKVFYCSCNSGITYTISGNLAIYGGVGLTQKRVFRQYYDSYEILGKDGKYWIEDILQNEYRLNFMAGSFFRLTGDIILQAGFDSYPKSFVWGVGVTF
jgi:opacity protein-like surface antigen